MLELLIFFIITVIFFLFRYFIKSDSNLRIANGLYVFTILLSQFYFNMALISKVCSGNINTGYTVLVTILPWFLIFGTIVVMLYIFPGWKRPFSNTFGYIVTKIAGINELLFKLLKSPISGDNQMKKTLHNIYTNPALFINEINPGNFDDFVKNSAFMFVPNAITSPAMSQFKNMIKMKDLISEFIWYLLTGLLVTSSSYNMIINSNCNQSVDEMKKRHDQYEKDVANAEKEAKEAPPERVYYIRD